jgi:hypothetical protein
MTLCADTEGGFCETFLASSQSQAGLAIGICFEMNLSSVYLNSKLKLIDTQTVYRPGVL